MNKLSSVSGLIRQTLQDFQREAKIVLAVGALAALPALLISIVAPSTSTPTLSWALYAIGFGVIFIFWSSLVSAGMYAKIAHPDEIHTMDEAMQAGMKGWVRYWTTAMLQWLYTALPIILALIAFVTVVIVFIKSEGGSLFARPNVLGDVHTYGMIGIIALVLLLLAALLGSYYSIKFLFSGFLVFKENLANMSALRRSGELTRGRVWDIAAKLFVFGLFMSLISIALAIIDGIATAPMLHTHLASIIDELFRWIQWMISLPLGLLFIANLYHDIIRANTSPSV